LAPLLAAELFGALARVAHESETAILMVEQNARRALKMANRAYLLSLGRIVGEAARSRSRRTRRWPNPISACEKKPPSNSAAAR
jgi:ABC-type branched-subunit amino acid transport system ATPase component